MTDEKRFEARALAGIELDYANAEIEVDKAKSVDGELVLHVSIPAIQHEYVFSGFLPGDKVEEPGKMTHTTAGQIAFEAYNEDRGGVNYRGERTPDWQDLPPEIRVAWEAAALATIDVVNSGPAYKSFCSECDRPWLRFGVRVMDTLNPICPQCSSAAPAGK